MLSIAGIAACVHKPEVQTATPITADGNYPPEIAKIIVTKCATAGCHDQADYLNSDSLLLDTWDHMFDGSGHGEVIVPYNTQYSLLLYYVNTDSTLGLTEKPTMPEGKTPLTHDEYMTLYNWIANGAPDKNGNIPFATNADTRQKIYLTQQGCDLLAVIDAEKQVVMRYVDIGADPSTIESPHCVRVSDDGMHAYVSFLNGNYVQKIDTRTDQVVGQANVGSLIAGGTGGSWNILHISPGLDTSLITSDWQGDGLIGMVNTSAMQVETNETQSGSGLFVYPHGIECNPTFDTFYVTAQYGNVVYKVSLKGGPYYKRISINGQPAVASALDSTNTSSPNPHEILMAPDYAKYFLTCQSTNEVRVMDPHTDTVIAAIPVGTFPQEMAISKSKHYLFVTCMEDAATPISYAKGSVYVIDYNTLQVVKVIYGDFYQPHGIAVDEQYGRIYIASTNANPNGPAPHHVSSCGGRDGWYTVYDLNTLLPVTDLKRYEVTVMPYSAAIRFK